MLAVHLVRAFSGLRRSVLASLLAAGLLVFGTPAATAKSQQPPPQPLRVVASFSILGDMVRQIGGEHVALTTIVGPGGDAHAFEPAPRDVQALANAQVLVLNGLDFEGWLPRLIQASGFKGRQVLASDGVKVRLLGEEGQLLLAPASMFAGHGHAQGNGGSHDSDHRHDDGRRHDYAAGEVDPHAWQDLANGIIYARNIAEGLARADPAHSSSYRTRAAMYIKKMEKLDAEIKSVLKGLAADRRTVITSHDAFGYFGRAYGLRFISVSGFSSDAEPSARDVAFIVDNARKQHVAGIFFESMGSRTLMEQIARETGARTGGTLYSDALAPEGQPAGTYLGLFSWNAGRLIRALKP